MIVLKSKGMRWLANQFLVKKSYFFVQITVGEFDSMYMSQLHLSALG